MNDNSKIVIKYNGKKYEIEPVEEEKEYSPKDGKETDKKIKVKNYKKGGWNHTCECSEDGGKSWNKLKTKWGKGKHLTIWGIIPIVIAIIAVAGFLYWKKRKEVKIEE